MMEAFLIGIFRGIIAAATIIAILFTLNCIYVELKKKDSCSKSGMRVVRKGKLPKEKVECPYCHSIIEYTKRNVWYGGKSIDGKMLRHYVDCPVCHENILVREEEGGEE